jgi:hypothetical protein
VGFKGREIRTGEEKESGRVTILRREKTDCRDHHTGVTLSGGGGTP